MMPLDHPWPSWPASQDELELIKNVLVAVIKKNSSKLLGMYLTFVDLRCHRRLFARCRNDLEMCLRRHLKNVICRGPRCKIHASSRPDPRLSFLATEQRTQTWHKTVHMYLYRNPPHHPTKQEAFTIVSCTFAFEWTHVSWMGHTTEKMDVSEKT